MIDIAGLFLFLSIVFAVLSLVIIAVAVVLIALRLRKLSVLWIPAWGNRQPGRRDRDDSLETLAASASK